MCPKCKSAVSHVCVMIVCVDEHNEIIGVPFEHRKCCGTPMYVPLDICTEQKARHLIFEMEMYGCQDINLLSA
jgi:hypothetical protein